MNKNMCYELRLLKKHYLVWVGYEASSMHCTNRIYVSYGVFLYVIMVYEMNMLMVMLLSMLI